eukprot:TRINITY_DN14037_c0_g1_i1.p1 TRINITY_DN14037_c0_g1~~TRINITY_DN14037_c0_g1_i1.p1  ORF type:complete len:569 (+),score=79.86 TRINITY_DN14037_c0_g1_i1:164-1870(+)
MYEILCPEILSNVLSYLSTQQLAKLGLVTKKSAAEIWSSAPFLVINLHRTNESPHPYVSFIHYTGAALRSVELCDTRGLPDVISHFADLCPNLETLRVPRDVLISHTELSNQFSRLLPRLKTLEFFRPPAAYAADMPRVNSESHYVQKICLIFDRVKEPIALTDLKLDFAPQSKQWFQHMQNQILNRISESLENISMPLTPEPKLLGNLFGKCKNLRSIHGLKQLLPSWRFDPMDFAFGALEALAETKVGLDITIIDEFNSEHTILEEIFHSYDDIILDALEKLETVPQLIRPLEARALRGLFHNKQIWDVEQLDGLKAWMEAVVEKKFVFFPDLETFKRDLPWLLIAETSLEIFVTIVETIGMPVGLDPAAICAKFLTHPDFDPKYAPVFLTDPSILSNTAFNMFYHVGSLAALQWLLESIPDRNKSKMLICLHSPGNHHSPISSTLCRVEYIDIILDHFGDGAGAMYRFTHQDQFVDVAQRLLEQNADVKYLKLLCDNTGLENIGAEARGKVLMFACANGTTESFFYWLKLIQTDATAPNLFVVTSLARGHDLIMRPQARTQSYAN